ncbi:phosphoenolpyruvate phosphomutase [Clostridium saccharoperbutylacetonicum]|uniref:phosphoenolpyruvate mutase n=1 Tax=Clostridium saccharoperbutylacetonicum N1-4(HMT) TaxID=931276 RepID=M1N4K1_9CLOT|nr:phosphoenolpyruvate mutase [Clostridium saccharoperbutylacetonicum]AGF58372.1 phosphoenolpyruvate phosphomutase Ppm [Clostridium saccharoperbutylacetonicum N1-4(HMT)]NRT60850.1 phosphoenolpyruvate phosphomutase [Clostridium saccharoperbutylacetonicum]NSB24164.1 phosphoenolpyruvate phosphomutase [Clostridium saccharoperbutylacetonicum]NSB43542.1 phosphoenolpyruvate phosphomutase [Clostridium saccharoperbutylacetonicum]
MKTVYVAMSADIIHQGHLNVLNEARKFGDVIVGLHTDDVIRGYWRNPIMKYEERKEVVSNIKGVVSVIPQDSLDQVPNIREIKPDYVLHGDDWKEGVQKVLRDKVIEAIGEWGGKLVEVPYTQGVSISKLDEELAQIGITPQMRMKSLKELIYSKKPVRILEAHNGLTGLIVEKTKVEKEGRIKEFDGMWISSLCDSTAKGKPDIELVDLTSRLNTINDILEVTTKPIIVDGDTGGQIEHFVYTVKTLERLGVSAIIIEDKTGLKKNSLFGTAVVQTQDTIEHFSDKIRAGREARVTSDFMIISRIESLIAGAGMEDAIERAKAYIEAGTDGIMIHSKEKNGEEIIKFCRRYNGFENKVPLVVVPTSYNFMKEDELIELGVSVVIYANHLIRSAYPAMVNTAKSILENGRSKEASINCMPIKEILTLIPGGM